jgi:hypothetical protein
MSGKRINRILHLVVIAALALSWPPVTSATVTSGSGAQGASRAGTHLATASPAALPCGVGEVSGTIRAADTGQPLPNVGVTAAGYSYLTTSTDANGHYAFQYQTANGPTSISLAVDQVGRYVGVTQNRLFDVVSGTVTTMNFTLNVGASIAGVVHATDVVSPLQQVSVVLSPTTALAGSPGGQRFTSTDANGYYQFLGIAPGGYKLRFDPSYGSTFDFSLNKYMPAYYGGAGDAASAAVITVTTPHTITANMLLSPGATIVGDVYAADGGVGLKDYRAYAYSTDQPEFRADAIRYSGTASYAIQGLRPGTYRLAVYPFGAAGNSDTQDYVGQYYDNQVIPTSAEPIVITQITQTVGINVVLQRGGVVTGVVRDANTARPIAGVGITLRGDAPSFAYAGSSISTGATTDASGVYTATGLPSGHYLADFTYVQGYTPPYYSQVYNGHDVISSTVAGDWVTVTAPLTVTHISFSLHRILTGTVAGRVTDPLGQGIAYVSVQFDRTDSTSAFGRIYAYTDVHGYYTTTVNATAYFVEFSRNTTAQCGGCYNDQFYTQSGQSRPTAVNVTVGSVVSNISATLKCGQAPPKRPIYLPRIVR